MVPIAFFAALLYTSALANYVTLSDRYTADPSPFVHNGRLFIYTSHDLDTQRSWHMKDYSLMSTDDLSNWRDEGIVFDIDTGSSWGKYAWAQQVIEGEDGKFYMYYPGMTSRGPGNKATGTGVAVSSSVAGPFLDALGHPLLPCGDDPTVFRDDDGQVYFCGNCGGPLCGKLASNMTAFLTPPALLTPALPVWFEAPWLSKWKGTYYLSYMCSGNGLTNTSHYGSDICYGSCSGPGCSPLGPYVFRGSLMWNPPNDCGPVHQSCADPHLATGSNNHQGIVEFPQGSGFLYLAYHSRTLSKNRGAYLGYQRNVAIDRLYSRGDAATFPLPPVPWALNDDAPGAGPGMLPVTSTPAWVRQLKYLDPFSLLPGVLSSLMSPGLNSVPCSEGGLALGLITENATSTLQGLDFGDSGSGGGASAVVFRAATPLDGGWVALEGSGGVQLVNCSITNSGGWQAWKNYTCALPALLQGILPSLTLRFGSSVSTQGSLLNLQYLTFLGEAGASPPTPRVPGPVAVPVALRSAATGLYWAPAAHAVIPTSTLPIVFTLVDQEDGTWIMYAPDPLGLLCTAPQHAGGWVAPNATATPADACTRFFLYGTTAGSFALLDALGGRFVGGTAQGGGGALAAGVVDPRLDAWDGARHFLEVTGH